MKGWGAGGGVERAEGEGGGRRREGGREGRKEEKMPDCLFNFSSVVCRSLTSFPAQAL